MRHIKLLLLLASLSCLSLHCKKEEDEINKLPPATSYGAGTFGCLMNGKAWPINKGGYLVNYVSYANGGLEIQYNIYDDPWGMSKKEWVVLIPKKIYNVGEHLILFNDSKNGSFSAKFHDLYYSSGSVWNMNGYAVVNISRLDTANKVKVISGTFNFTLLDETGTSKLKITKGRFDLAFL